MPTSRCSAVERCSRTKKGDEAASCVLESALAADLLPLTVPEVRRLLRELVWHSAPPADRLLQWSRWRRRHQQRAKRGHYRKRQRRSANEVRL